jgi:PhnB protein
MSDVIPFLSCEDVGTVAAWLVRVFGFQEIERLEEDGEVGHVTLRAGDGLIFLGHPGAEYINPRRLRARSELVARMYAIPLVIDGVLVYVDRLDEHYEHARASGATIVSEPEDTPHGRQYRVEDEEGHRWLFQQRP